MKPILSFPEFKSRSWFWLAQKVYRLVGHSILVKPITFEGKNLKHYGSSSQDVPNSRYVQNISFAKTEPV